MRVFYFMIFLLLASFMLAQEVDKYQSDEDQEHYISYNQWLIGDTLNKSDTSLMIVDKICESSYNDLGALVSPSFFQMREGDIWDGFSLGPIEASSFFYSKKNTNYSLHPFPSTNMRFLTGSNNLQGIGVEHRQMIGRDFVWGWDFRKLSALGLYSAQETKLSNNHLFVQIMPIRPYSLQINFSNNKIDADENGGLQSMSYYSLDTQSTRALVPINYSSANSVLFRREFSFIQRLKLSGFNNLEVDSVNVDSASVNISERYLIHELDYLNFYRTFNNDLDNIFATPFTDNMGKADSLGLSKLTNRLTYLHNFKNLKLAIGAFHELHDKSFKDSINHNDQSLNMHFRLSSDGVYNHKLDFNYGLYGYSEGNYSFDYSLMRSKGKLRPIFDLQRSAQRSDWVYSYWNTLQDSASSGLDKLTYSNIKLGLSINELISISAGMSEHANYIYMNGDALVSQADNFLLPYFELDLNLKFGRFLLDGIIKYVSSDNIYMPLPDIASKTSLSYLGLLKKKFQYQMGMEVFYMSDLQAYGYIPELGLFYNQNTNIQSEAYRIDLFVRFKVKRFRTFFKVHHLNQLWTRRSYHYTALYPINDLSFSLGISWKMFY